MTTDYNINISWLIDFIRKHAVKVKAVKPAAWLIALCSFTTLFTMPPAEPFLAFPGKIPVEQQKSLQQRMGQRSLNTVPAGGRQSGGLVNNYVKLKVTHSDSPVPDKNFFWTWLRHWNRNNFRSFTEFVCHASCKQFFHCTRQTSGHCGNSCHQFVVVRKLEQISEQTVWFLISVRTITAHITYSKEK